MQNKLRILVVPDFFPWALGTWAKQIARFATKHDDKFLKDKSFKIFVVDNGKTLNQEEFQDTRVKLIPNKNLGGSGGFARGLVEAIQEGGYTHFLFMDDDISLDSESIYRLLTLYEYAKDDFAVSGCWLDLMLLNY